MSDLLNRIDLNFDFIAAKLANHIITERGCWEYQGQRRFGYGRFQLTKPNKRKFVAHRVSYAFYTGIDPGEMMVCHRCDNPGCINPDHLFLGTAKDNTRDMQAKGRAAPQYGEHNARAKITEAVVLQVVAKIREGAGNTKISQDLPVSHGLVSLIRRGKVWQHVLAEAGYKPEQHQIFKRRSTCAA